LAFLKNIILQEKFSKFVVTQENLRMWY